MQLGSHVAVALVWPAAAALIRPLAWEPPYVVGVAQEKAKRQKKKKERIPHRRSSLCGAAETKAQRAGAFRLIEQ